MPPWEKYQKSTPGPWSKYKAAEDIGPARGTSVQTGQQLSEGEMLRNNQGIKASGELVTGEQFARPMLEFGGLMAGGAGGSLVAGPVGGVAMGGAGYATGKKIADTIYGSEGRETPMQDVLQTGKDVFTGAQMEAGGQVLGKAVPWVMGKVGGFAKEVHGRLTGLGRAATEDAISAGKQMGGNPFKDYSDFDKALRGKISGEEVVSNARNALQTLKDARESQYISQLEKLSQNQKQVDLRPMGSKIANLLKKYVRIDPKTKTVDWDRSALGTKDSEGVKKIKDIMETIQTWGSKPEDATPVGLDMLKRQLDGFYSESSQARAFVTSLRNIVKNELVSSVPEYAKMTKGYSEATKLIKDVEAGLMMRKQGMTGRIVADQTLRRLLSSTKDNFQLRRELVKSLANTGEDITGQISGYAMRSPVPVGLAGTGPALLGNVALAKFVSPAFWPVLASSSPRVSAEFLRMFGKTLATIEGTGPTLAKAALYAKEKGSKSQ